MILLRKNSTDPWFNLAAEEFAVKHLREEVLMLWESDRCVVVGKHQLAYAEINPAKVFGHNIPVIRRISGGGTVVHGPGNLNFSLINDNSRSTNKIDFQKALRQVISFLESVGLYVELTGVSNLSVSGLKISGNAAHVFKNRSLHHGTLLFNSDLEIIQALIKRPEQPYASRAIKSKPAPIANISQLTKVFADFDEFKQSIETYLIKALSINDIRTFTEVEETMIRQLAAEKYRSFAWNFGYSPDYVFNNALNVNGNVAKVELEVQKGIIKSVKVDGNTKLMLLNDLLPGQKHCPETLGSIIFKSRFSDVFSEADINQLIFQLF